MSVFLGASCDRCGAEHRPDRPVRSFSPGAVRTRAAFHGWVQAEEHGVVLDVCPACVQAAVPAAQQAASRVLVGAGAPVVPPVAVGVVHAALLDVEVARCGWCADGQHQWCAGCDCSACS